MFHSWTHSPPLAQLCALHPSRPNRHLFPGKILARRPRFLHSNSSSTKLAGQKKLKSHLHSRARLVDWAPKRPVSYRVTRHWGPSWPGILRIRDGIVSAWVKNCTCPCERHLAVKIKINFKIRVQSIINYLDRGFHWDPGFHCCPDWRQSRWSRRPSKYVASVLAVQ